jgi:hypothetical protein
MIYEPTIELRRERLTLAQMHAAIERISRELRNVTLMVSRLHGGMQSLLRNRSQAERACAINKREQKLSTAATVRSDVEAPDS